MVVRRTSLVKFGECFSVKRIYVKKLYYDFSLLIWKKNSYENVSERFLWKVMFSSIIYNVKAWFDDYDFNIMFLWDDANFCVHIKSEGHHGVYKLHGNKKLTYALKWACKA